MSDIIWPERPLCHGDEPSRITGNQYSWRVVEYTNNADHARSCDYCGSMHPEDLVWWVERGMRLEGADWKYGWAHKFYLRGGPPYPTKFYNEHLLDLDDEAFALVADLIKTHTRIEFFKNDEGQLMHRAPRYNYQAG